MMNNTKEIKAFYEKIITKRIEEALSEIKANGFTSDTYATLRSLQYDLQNMNSAQHFFNAWNEESIRNQQRIGA